MKIGILTFHAACNYGAFLQAYALSSKASEYAEAEIIDYICEPIEQSYEPEKILGSKMNPFKKYIKFWVRKHGMEANRTRFRAATERYLPIGSKRVSGEQLPELEKLFDRFIVGSDQVWNTDITKFDATYFLDFVRTTNKKASFAASVGTPRWTNEEENNIREYLLDFRYISVRESGGKARLIKLTDRNDIIQTIDPVFLKSKSEWIAFAKIPPMDDYVLFFMMGVSDTANSAYDYAAKLARKQKKKLVLLSDQNRPYYHPEVKHLVGIGPEEFVGYLVKASCVISNSFHATALSIILEKEFWVETCIKRAERITELLTSTGLSDRALVKGSVVQERRDIDWKTVKSNVQMLVEDANAYLKLICTENEA